MSRLLEEFARQKEAVSKYTPYLLADYIGVAQTHALPAEAKAALLPGVYAGVWLHAMCELNKLHMHSSQKREMKVSVYVLFGIHYGVCIFWYISW